MQQHFNFFDRLMQYMAGISTAIYWTPTIRIFGVDMSQVVFFNVNLLSFTLSCIGVLIKGVCGAAGAYAFQKFIKILRQWSKNKADG